MKKKIICLFVLTAMLSTGVSGQTFFKVYDRYIADFHDVAIETMQKYNVPASILLAQGMLESVGGTSVLVTEANNHFGIGCQDWDGEIFMHKLNEFALTPDCFRKYESAAESFEDQARILKFNPRYKVLSQYTPDNYQAWAMGLQHAGYATSTEYADRLIKLIRHYKLYKYDREALRKRSDSNFTEEQQTIVNQPKNNQKLQQAERNEQIRADRKARQEQRIAAREQRAAERQARRTNRQNTRAPETTIKAPKAAEQPIVVNQNFSVGETRLIRQYDVDRVNGVKFIVAREGDTFFSIARAFGIALKDLHKFNDVPVGVDIELKKGDLVFLQMKRTIAARGYGFHQVQEGESMYSISQMYAIRLANLYKLNKMSPDEQLTVGRILRLR